MDEALRTLEWQLGPKLLQHDGLFVRIGIEDWLQAGQTAKDELGCTYFSFLSAIDWLPNPGLDGEKVYATDKAPPPPPEVITDEAVRKAGGTSRFQLVARVANVEDGVGLTLLADLQDDMKAPSWVPLYPGADWHEREAAEMFGIDFEGHPDLRHIYLPDEFEGHPLRKDFPLLAREVRPWPGLVDMEEMPGPTPEEDTA